jgi:uncharacterized phiE125 gp8 family phage protein
MILVELTPVPAANLPIAEFRDHLLLGTGFADDAAQDTVLEAQLRAAISAIEARTQKALYARPFRWKLTSWRGFQREELPVAPVTEITSLKIVEDDGSETVIPEGAYALEPDTHHPALAAKGFGLPTVPVAGSIEVEFTAGFAPAWEGIPAALRQAVLILAADFYEHRRTDGPDAVLPTRVMQLIAPYRVVRLFGRRR